MRKLLIVDYGNYARVTRGDGVTQQGKTVEQALAKLSERSQIPWEDIRNGHEAAERLTDLMGEHREDGAVAP